MGSRAPCGFGGRPGWGGSAGLGVRIPRPLLGPRSSHSSRPRPDHEWPLPVRPPPDLFRLPRAAARERPGYAEHLAVAAVAAFAFRDTHSSGVGGAALAVSVS